MDLEPAFAAQFAAVRWVHFGACLLLLGVWMFDRLMVGSTAQQQRAALATGPWNVIAYRLIAIAWPLAMASGVAWFVLVAMSMSDLPLAEALHLPVLKLVGAHTQFGRVWQLRTVLLVIALPAALIWRALPPGPARIALAWLNLLINAAVVAALAWSGHGGTGPAPEWHRAADVLHLLVSAIWPIGLLPLALLLMHVGRSRFASGRWALAASVLVVRFSAFSLFSVGLLTATGLVNSWCLVGSFPALWQTPYGRVLLMKIALFAGMLVLGAINLLVLKPRLGIASVENGAATVALQSANRLLLSVVIELLLGILVVATVGVLGLLQPGRV